MIANALPTLTSEVAYLLLIFGLVVIPRALQRFRIPAPLTSIVFGIIAAIFLRHFSHDVTLALLAALGISSLFLFAGLEIQVRDLRRSKWALLGHLVVRCLTVAGVVSIAMGYFALSWQTAVLLALALLTPSTGFILDTLSQLGLNEAERYWVSTKAVAGELLALLALFIVLQSGSAVELVWSSAVLLAIIIGLPLLFVLLGRVIVPHAPGSEFSLLIMMGLIAAYFTYQLGVYYLVGAFLAGFTARMLRDRMPGLASDENLHAVKLFASFFVPFYFFDNGLRVPSGALTWAALGLGLLLTAIVLPLRVGVIWLQRRFVAHESALSSLRVATALMPTLIFTLVLSTILHEQFGISDVLYGALLVYAALSTLLPSLLLLRPLEFDFRDLPPSPTPDGEQPASTMAVAQVQTEADGDESDRRANSTEWMADDPDTVVARPNRQGATKP